MMERERVADAEAEEQVVAMPLSFAQQRLWFLDQLESGSTAYNIPASLRLRGPLDPQALERALGEVVRRHEVLRTVFRTLDGRPVQVVQPWRGPPRLDVVDLTGAGQDAEAGVPGAATEVKGEVEAEVEAAAMRLVQEDAAQPFDLVEGPVLRAALLRLAPEDHILRLTFHHVAFDGWSQAVFARELAACYEAFAAGRAPDLPEPPIQYADFAAWQREWLEGEAREAQLAYWRGRLEGVQPLDLPTDKPRPATRSLRGASVPFHVPKAASDRLRALAREEGATLYMPLLAAFQVLLHRYNGQLDVTVGSPVAGREQEETQDLIGFFVNMLVMRGDLRGDPTFRDLLLRTRETCLEAYAHQALPFEKLVDELHPDRNLSRSPLFEVAFDLVQDMAGGDGDSGGRAAGAPQAAGLRWEGVPVAMPFAKFDLVLGMRDTPQGLEGRLEYATDLFHEATVRRMTEHLVVLLEGIAARPDEPISRLPLLTSAEEAQLLRDGSPSASAAPDHATAHAWFEAHARARPDAVAVEVGAGGPRLTYAELDARANRLARHLRGLGVGADTVVGLAVGRDLDLMVGLLGILKAGGAYLPLDPSYPRERLAYMLEDSRAAVLVTQAGLAPGLPSHARTVLLDGEADAAAIAAQSSAPLPAAGVGAGPRHLAYVIYTSGSTGRPKGTMLAHAGLVNLAHAQQRAFGQGPGKRVLQFASLSFDASTWETAMALLSGATLVLVPDEDMLSGPGLHGLLQEARITHVTLPPTVARTLPEEPLPELELVVTAGEAVPRELVQAWAPGRTFVNAYGPTETTVCASLARVTGREPTSPPIGRPIANMRCYVLDAWHRPVPAGVPGELCVGGVQLARGYLGRPDLTAERFIPDPFAGSGEGASAAPGSRLYRTGDLVRWLPDGNLEFLGRVDHQVKVRGFRVEPGEIEAALASHPQVGEAVVLAREDLGGAVAGAADAEGGAAAAAHKRLVAYVTSQDGAAPTVGAMREFLGARLPDYMVPGAFVVMDAFPLTPSGKVDRRALPAPEAGRAGAEAPYMAPRTPTEEALARIWGEVLRVPQVGVHDGFFELGGDSILSIQVVAKAHEAGLRITPKQMFQHQTIAELAAVADDAAGPGAVHAGAAGAEQGVLSGPLPLTPIQRWFLEQEPPEAHHFNQSLLFEAPSRLDAGLLRQAVAGVLAHHDALRMRVRRGAQGWEVELLAGEPHDVVEELDLSRWGGPEPRAAALTEACRQAQRSLSLEHGPLTRLLLVDLGQAGQRLLWVVHHLAVDGVSWGVLLEDLQACYAAAARGEAPHLPPKTTSARAWAEALQAYAASEAAQAQLAWWTRPEAREVAPLPRDHPGDAGPGTVGEARRVAVELTPEETGALLKEVPRAYRTRINDALLAALAQALHRWTGQPRALVALEGHGREEDVVGAAVAGSPAPDLTRTAGWFTALHPVLLDLPPEAGPGAALKASKEQLRAVPDKGLGHGALRWLGGEEARAALAAMPEPEIAFNYLGQFDAGLQARDASGAGHGGRDAPLLRLAPEDRGSDQGPRHPRAHLLEVNGAVSGGRLVAEFTYAPAVHGEATVRALAEGFAEALRGLIAHCASPGAGGLTPSDVALAHLDQATLDGIAARAAARGHELEDLYPLTPMQKGMLFHSLYERGSTLYFEQAAFTLVGDLDAEAWVEAWERVLAHHAVLRTAFLWEDLVEPMQAVYRAGTVELPVDRLDLRGLAPKEQAQRAAAYQAREQERGFALDRPPLLRLGMLRLRDDATRVVMHFHHALLDGWSVPLLLEHVFRAYAALRRGGEPDLPWSPPYRAYIAWLQAQSLPEAEAYWRSRLEGFEAPTPLVVDRPLGQGASPVGREDVGEHFGSLGPEASARLHAMARQHGLTPNSVVLGAWALLLSRYAREEDVVFGATVSGRPPTMRGVEGMVGMCINTLPVRVRATPGTRVADWLRGLQAQQVETREFEYTPLGQVQGWSDVPPGTPLFHSFVIFENYPVSEAAQEHLAGLRVQDVRAVERANYPIALVAGASGDVQLKFSYDRARFDTPTLERMMGHLTALLEGLSARPQAALEELPLLAADEERLVVGAWNGTARDWPRGRTVPELVDAQAAQRPDAVAVDYGADGGGALTYAQLRGQANRLAHHLRGLGVRRGTPVGLAVERGPAMVVGMLGILKAGGAYVPLDPDYPEPRLRFMLEDTGAPVLVTQTALAGRLPAPRHVVRLDAPEDAAAIAAQPGEAPPPDTGAPEDLAYVIYTSGSTGMPKGVAVTHRNIGRLVFDTEYVAIGPGDGVAQAANANFDAATFEVWAPLVLGARIVGVGRDVLLSPERLAARVRGDGISVMFLTTALFNQVARAVPDAFAGMKAVLFGGEMVDPGRVRDVLRAGPPERLLHVYGPTETTTFASWHLVREVAEDATNVPIGRGIANTTLYVLDPHLQPLPPGVPGELCIGGEGGAMGYLHRPELTAERFVPDPFAAREGVPGARMYRTGDLVRWLAMPDGSGAIEFVGRIDHQVKVRGFRIELGEVEVALQAHPKVAQVLVTVRRDDGGEKRLVAYLSPKAQDGEPTTPELREWLGERMPDYMVPQHFVVLPHLPLNPNGKVDRKALPAPEAMERPDLGTDYAAPGNPVEEALAELWARMLKVERVGVHDNFFELGGDSILSIQIVARAAQRGIHLTPGLIFQHQTIAELAAVARTSASADQAEQGAVTGEVPLTPIQRWFFSLDWPDPGHFNQSWMLEVPEDAEHEHLARALQAVVDHHDALRLRYERRAPASNGGATPGSGPQDAWTQRIAPPGEAVPLEVVDLFDAPPPRQQQAMAAKAEEVQAGLDLEAGPLVRGALFDLGVGKPKRLLLVVNHLAIDAVSWSHLLADLEAAWRAISSGEAPALPAKTTSFKAWADRLVAHAGSEALREELPYWTAEERAHVKALPRDREEGPNVFPSARMEVIELDEAETRDLLQEVPKAYRTRINDVLITALAQALRGWTGEARLLASVEGHGREEDALHGDGPPAGAAADRLDVSRTVGWFTSMYPVLVHLPQPDDMGASLKAVKEQLRAVPNKGIGYGVLRWLGPADVRARLAALPQPEISFNYLGQMDGDGDAPAREGATQGTRTAPGGFRRVGTLGSEVSPSGVRGFALEVNGMVAEGRLHVMFRYSEHLHTEETVRRLAQDFLAALRALIAHCTSGDDRGFTPSDFPLAQLDQGKLDALLKKVVKDK